MFQKNYFNFENRYKIFGSLQISGVYFSSQFVVFLGGGGDIKYIDIHIDRYNNIHIVRNI